MISPKHDRRFMTEQLFSEHTERWSVLLKTLLESLTETLI